MRIILPEASPATLTTAVEIPLRVEASANDSFSQVGMTEAGCIANFIPAFLPSFTSC